jgi:ABC-type sugar transport system ATPase subunit
MSFGLKLRNTPKDEIQARVRRAADMRWRRGADRRAARALRSADDPLRRELYRIPVDEFAQRVLTVKGKPAFVTEGGVELPLKSAPSNIDGRPCIYGIRPEHLAIGGDFKAEVSVVEPTGSETQVFAKVGGEPIVTVFRDRVSAQPGQSLLLSPNLDAVHLFDAESGKRLE